ncbi:transcription initiation factor IIA subunit 2-like [Drosophila obscura]|uniref:transcription initiation factor IIA subunit 2-like n=1 Tax=Drosophila obscura TaxID=7282 RepID=UPI001BB1316B|nr:transcription initiation factor IIA subunit 2-like [Drosophila obscura]
MDYQLYRTSTLGNTLQDTLDELIQRGEITPVLARTVLQQFDKSTTEAIKQNAKSRLTFKGTQLHSYQFCDNVWTLRLKDVTFSEKTEILKVDKVKIVACECKGENNEKK